MTSAQHCNYLSQLVPLENQTESPSDLGSITQVRVYLLIQNRLLREALVRLIRKRADLLVVGQGAPLNTRSAAVLESQCDILLLDSLHAGAESAELAAWEEPLVGAVKTLLISMDADEKQFAILFPKKQFLREHGGSARSLLEQELGKDATQGSADTKDKLAQREANAAVALLKMGSADKVWPLLKHRPNPSMRSYLIHRFGPLEAEPLILIRRATQEKDVEIRRALFLGLGEFGDTQLLPDTRKKILPRLWDEYGQNEDPGIHGAIE